MSGWNWKRIGALIGGGLAIGVSYVFPALPFLAELRGVGAYLIGVATKTPGHVATSEAVTPPPLKGRS